MAEPDWNPVAPCEKGAAHIVTEGHPCTERFTTFVTVSEDNGLFLCTAHAEAHAENKAAYEAARVEEECTDPEPAIQEPPC